MRIVRLFHTARPAAVAGIAAAAALVAVAGCATTAPANASSGGGGNKITVVAAENFWGSIASQLGGTHASVTSIITNPDTDPHSYEATPADGRTMAGAQFAIVNGIGYDPWAPKLLAADPNPNRTVLTVGTLVGIPDGGNPHRWYSPANVHQVIEQISADYAKIDPADAAYFQQRKETFENSTLAQYNQLIAQIKAKYAGTPIGASESIVSPLAEGLGLTMLTPETFLDAISEGSDPTAADKATIDAQIRNKQIKIYVYNSQNSTPDVQAQVAEAKAAGIPVTTVTETLAPANVTFQAWQVKELQGIEQALAKATGK
ncbi:MAG TPA: zinc ABC transporter substrate-binding protein [Pseudonocardiaceae bacterium]|jgi:zinc/manganese transport system substrate-binding protein|nr:zinc ABC transporter substrate-binding protein [Pseudonocardiaceae bacterium]